MDRVGERKRRIENLSDFRSVFWDITDLSHMDLDDRREYIIQRVLENGEPEHAAWLLARYPLAEVKAVLANNPGLPHHVRDFWSKVLAGL